MEAHTLSTRRRFKKPRLADVLLLACKPTMKAGNSCRCARTRHLTIALHELGGDIYRYEDLQDYERDRAWCGPRQPLRNRRILPKLMLSSSTGTSIAVTLPCLNSEQGIVLQMPHYNVENLALGPEIYKEIKSPVFNKPRYSRGALAEKRFGGNFKMVHDNSVLISICLRFRCRDYSWWPSSAKVVTVTSVELGRIPDR